MNKSEKPHYNFKVRGKVLDLSTPKVMGILNVTPDSFSDGGEYNDLQTALNRIAEMAEQGAVIIDIGGESTRPGSDPVTPEEESQRVLPVLEEALKQYPELYFSVDTTKFSVAKSALELGAHMINDVSGLQKEARFAELCAEFDAGYVLMHTQGDPKTMQVNPQYEDAVDEILIFLQDKIEILEKSEVKCILVDPGIGFGKRLEHNLQIISELHKFTKFGYPVMMGASRKSMIGRILDGRSAEGRLAGTLAVHYHSLVNGARVIRVHDVQEAWDSIQVFNAIKNSSTVTPNR